MLRGDVEFEYRLLSDADNHRLLIANANITRSMGGYQTAGRSLAAAMARLLDMPDRIDDVQRTPKLNAVLARLRDAPPASDRRGSW